jgi:hypothetical protein
METIMKTNVVTDVRDAKKAFDEVSLARVYVMAAESLCPDTFEAFEKIFLELKDRRSLSGIAERVGNEEWECPECGQKGNYEDIRKPLDSGVDKCPNCSEEVKCLE